MEVKILKQDKNEIEVESDSVTLVEILRVYLNKNSAVTFAAWNREHFTKKPVLKVKTSGKDAKSIVEAAIKAVVSDLDKVETEFKALK